MTIATIGTDRNESTALMAAAEAGNEDIVQLLLDNKAGIDRKANGYMGPSTAFSLAIQAGHAGVARILLDHGAVIGQPGVTALWGALSRGNLDCMTLLLDQANTDERNAINPNILLSAASNGSLEGVKVLLDHGIKPLPSRLTPRL